MTAGVFAVLTLAGMLLTEGRLAEKIPVPISYVLVGYFVSGVAGGVLVGVALPHVSGRWGAYLLGVLGGFPYFFTMGLLFSQFDIRIAAIAGAVLSILGGGPIGMRGYEGEREPHAR